MVPCCNLKYLGLLIKGFSDSTPVQLTQQEKRALGSEKNIMVKRRNILINKIKFLIHLIRDVINQSSIFWHDNQVFKYLKLWLIKLQFKGQRNFVFIPTNTFLMKTLQKWKKFIWECCFLIIFFLVKGKTLVYMMFWKP